MQHKPENLGFHLERKEFEHMNNIREYKGRVISKGMAEGEALVSHMPFSFMGSICDLASGTIYLGGHDLEGKSLKDKIFVYDTDYMSTSGCWGLLNMAMIFKSGPKAIIWREAHNISANAAIYAGIPAMDHIEGKAPYDLINTGDWVKVDADKGVIVVRKK